MSIYNTSEVTTGIDDIIVGTVAGVPGFIPMFLFFIFGVICLGGIVRQKRRLGSADIPMWVTMGSIGTLMVALILTLVQGLIQLEVLSIIIVVTIFSGLWLFLDRNRNEI